MMTPAQMIAAIEGHEAGKPMEYRGAGSDAWMPVTSPLFNFAVYDYRVKPEPREAFSVFTVLGLSGTWLQESSAIAYAARCNPDSMAKVVRMREVL